MKIGRLFRKIKTYDTVPTGYSRIPEVSVGVSAPTTATVGNHGDVIFDTDGNRWELIKIDGSTYHWAPDGFPALNTEYVSHYDTGLGKVVYKMAMETVTASAGGVASTAHGIIGFLRLHETPNVMIINGVGNNHLNYYFSTTDYFSGWVNSVNCQTNTPNNVALNNKTAYFKFKYIKV